MYIFETTAALNIGIVKVSGHTSSIILLVLPKSIAILLTMFSPIFKVYFIYVNNLKHEYLLFPVMIYLRI